MPTSQVSVQELSPMIRKGLTPIVFVINNSGYTIERCIHGKNRFVLASWFAFAFFNSYHFTAIITTSLTGIGPLYWMQCTMAETTTP